MRITENLL